MAQAPVKTVLVAIADGSEDLEDVTVIDVLRRASDAVNVTVATVGNKDSVVLSRGTKLIGDQKLENCANQKYDLIVCPGGMPGSENLGKDKTLINLLRGNIQSQRMIGAICAAPAIVLAQNKLLKNIPAVCYPDANFEKILKENEGVLQQMTTCISRTAQGATIVTSRGPATSLEFSCVLLELLTNTETAVSVASKMLTQYQGMKKKGDHKVEQTNDDNNNQDDNQNDNQDDNNNQDDNDNQGVTNNQDENNYGGDDNVDN